MDTFTITVRDTTFREAVRNEPGSGKDNGVVFPSSRVTELSRYTISYDSSYERQYPAFLRLGGLEFAGFAFSSTSNGIGPGLFGLYSIADSNHLTSKGDLRLNASNAPNNFFKGMLFRVAPMEYQLHWFNNAPNWTWGLSLFEMLAKDEQKNNSLTSFANLYIRKRYWIRDRTPYVLAAPYFGMSLFPSAYANVGGELLFGSFGGFNLRSYLGYAYGFNWATRNLVSFPYLGLGVSALDFTNRVEETEREWKEYVHSAIEVSMLNVNLLKSFGDQPSWFDSDTLKSKLPITGLSAQIGTAHFPLPFADNHFWAGSSLINFFSLGYGTAAMSFLPIRAGYRTYLIAEDLSFEPYAEFNYYPSMFWTVAGRLRLDTFSGITVGLLGGYAAGNSGAFLPKFLFDQRWSRYDEFGSAYVGLTIGLRDVLFTPEAVQIMRASEH